MEVRSVEARDVPAVIELVIATLNEFGLEFGTGSKTDDELRALPDSYATGAFWVAIDDDRVIGTCGVFPLAPDTYELRKMYLRPESRGRGVGKRLLDVAIEWARAKGARRLVLDTVDAMKQAIAFYEAHGFRRDDEQIRGARCNRGYTLEL